MYFYGVIDVLNKKYSRGNKKQPVGARNLAPPWLKSVILYWSLKLYNIGHKYHIILSTGCQWARISGLLSAEVIRGGGLGRRQIKGPGKISSGVGVNHI